MVAGRNEDFALALVDGAFTKALEVHLVRKVPCRALPQATAALSFSLDQYMVFMNGIQDGKAWEWRRHHRVWPNVQQRAKPEALYSWAVQVEGKQFVEAFAEALEPRLRLTGEMSTLDKFKAFFEDRSLEKGTEVRMYGFQYSQYRRAGPDGVPKPLAINVHHSP